MTGGQFRVLMLLVVLAVLEVAAHPTVKAYWHAAYASISASLARSQKSGSV
jgi:hypothetical protein